MTIFVLTSHLPINHYWWLNVFHMKWAVTQSLPKWGWDFPLSFFFKSILSVAIHPEVPSIYSSWANWWSRILPFPKGINVSRGSSSKTLGCCALGEYGQVLALYRSPNPLTCLSPGSFSSLSHSNEFCVYLCFGESHTTQFMGNSFPHHVQLAHCHWGDGLAWCSMGCQHDQGP